MRSRSTRSSTIRWSDDFFKGSSSAVFTFTSCPFSSSHIENSPSVSTTFPGTNASFASGTQYHFPYQVSVRTKIANKYEITHTRKHNRYIHTDTIYICVSCTHAPLQPTHTHTHTHYRAILFVLSHQFLGLFPCSFTGLGVVVVLLVILLTCLPDRCDLLFFLPPFFSSIRHIKKMSKNTSNFVKLKATWRDNL